MREPLDVAMAQPVCVPHDIDQNVRHHADAICLAKARVVVFPELSLTGYELDAAPVDPADSRLEGLVDACGRMGSTALVGAPIAGENSRSHIAMLAVDGDGVGVAYRKVWVAGSESHRFSPGDAPAVLELDEWRLGLGICRDTGIVQHQCDTAALGIDAYLAGTLMSVEETGIQDERGSRIAAEREVWVGFASFAGATGDGYDHAAGCSAVWSPGGRLVARAGAEPGAIVRATLQRV